MQGYSYNWGVRWRQRHPFASACLGALLVLGLGVWSIVVARDDWRLAVHPLAVLVVGGAVGIVTSGLWLHGALIKQYRVAGREKWLLRHAGALGTLGAILLVTSSPTGHVLSASLLVPLGLIGAVLVLTRAIRNRHDPVGADIESAHRSSVLGIQEPRPLLRRPATGSSDDAANIASKHWLRTSARRPIDKPSDDHE
jgi:hypothetical protein